MNFILNLKFVIWMLITLCYSYQLFYIFYMIFGGSKKDKKFTAEKFYKYGLIIAARNEEKVIGNLIDSIHLQNYPEELIEIYVIADNCTDNTAKICRDKGAIVYERNDKELIGKGYALNYLYKKILFKENPCDAYMVFDADNLLDKDFVSEMNKTFNGGYKVITSYRNSKNYDTNWISAGYSLWFMREAKFLNNPRMNLNTSCAISGTGFLISRDLLIKNKCWNFFMLTEDIQFSVSNILNGETIGYCKDAVLYDEQPTTLKQSYHQRLRWAKGFYQVMDKYSSALFSKAVKSKNFACFDMFMTIFPAVILVLIDMIIYSGIFTYSLVAEKNLTTFLTYIKPVVISMALFYIFLYLIGIITLISEWKKINCKKYKKILYTFTFPIFLLTYIPIAVIALFKEVEWVPITHDVSCTIENLTVENIKNNR